MQGKADAAAIDPQHVVITEPVRGSDIPVQLMYVETIDGLYAPIGLRTPPGRGRFRWCCSRPAMAAAAWRWCATSPRT